MEAAQMTLDFARKVQNPALEKTALSLLGGLHRKFGRKEQAIAAYQQALAIKTDNQIAGADATIYAGLGRVYRDLNQPNIAITYYKQSVNQFEEIRRSIQGLPPELQSSFLQATVDFERVKISDIYRQLADLLLSQGRTIEALQVRDLLGKQEIRDFIATRSPLGEKPQVPLTLTEKKIQTSSQSIIDLGQKIRDCELTNCPQRQELNNKQTALIAEFTQQLQHIDKEIRENRANDDVFFDPKNWGKIREIVNSQPGTVVRAKPVVAKSALTSFSPDV